MIVSLPLFALLTLAQAAQQAASAGGNAYVVWAVVALALSMALFALELFVPSGGTIGFAAVASLMAGIVLLFQVDTTVGLIGAIVCVVAVPFAFALSVRVWPHTPIVRWLQLRETLARGTTARPENDAFAPDGGDNSPLLHQVGKALTELRPVGACLIDGQRIECLSDRGIIKAGATVKVIAIDGMDVKVREVAE